MSSSSSLHLYPAHLSTIKARVDIALQRGGFNRLLVASGVEKMRFLDDLPYPFKANPQFKAWLPLVQHPHCWIAYTPGERPLLVYYQPDDYWHVPPSAPAGDWVEHFDIRVIDDPAQAAALLPAGGSPAILGEADAALPGLVPNNPKVVLDTLHYHRAYKTPYELTRMRQAQRRAVRGHAAARKAFLGGGSEAAINAAFLVAAGHTDSDAPYNNIVALNRNGATLHYHRAYKTPYELALMRLAQRKAVRGHAAARNAFLGGGSEAAINAAYLAAAGHTDSDLPYNNIVALNRNGATLHYQYKLFEAPKEHRSLLIDAGAEVDGYAADITRTWGRGDEDFEALVDAVDAEQRQLCGKVRAGTDYRDLHLEAHLRLGGVLRALEIVDMEPGQMLETGVSSVFFPHGLGHPIGLQVHDVAGFSDEAGNLIPRPPGHPFLRMTRTLEPGMVVTIEPGIYFIPSLLEGLKSGPHGKHVAWKKIEHLARFGGVRIEDEVHCTDNTPENLTRDAFAELEA